MRRYAARKKTYLSISLKIWFTFTVLFIPISIFMYVWIYNATVEHELDTLTTDLTHYVDGIVSTIDTDDFKALYEEEAARNENCPPPAGMPFEDEKNGYFPRENPLFLQHMEWIKNTVALHPERGVYTYVASSEKGYVLTIGSSWYFTNPKESFRFCQLYEAPNMYKTASEGERINIWEPYHDEYGYWITSFAPIRDENGVIIGGVAVDVPASLVVAIQKEHFRRYLIFSVVTALMFFLVLYYLSQIIFRPITRLAALTGGVKDGTSVADFSTVKQQSVWLRDEIDDLVFSVEDMLSRLNKQTAELSQSREKMQEVVHDTIRAQESERKYISRELHDEAGQLLITLKSALDDIIFEFPDDGDPTPPSKFDHVPLQKRLEDASIQIEKTLGVVRAISHQIRPSLLDVGDVNLALKSYCAEFSQRHKIEVIYEGVMIPNLPEDAAVSFYRFLQESLTNVFKHSSATRVRVRAQMDVDSVQMTVENDGRKNEVVSEANGIGIAGLKERFALLGGDVDIKIVPGGFIVVARIPLARL